MRCMRWATSSWSACLGSTWEMSPCFVKRRKSAPQPVATPLAIVVEKPALPPDPLEAPANHDNAAFWAAVAACGTLWVGERGGGAGDDGIRM